MNRRGIVIGYMRDKHEKKILSLTRKDFDVQHYKGSGPGGQNRNKNSTSVRIIHKASGAVGNSQEMKSQTQNKKLAFKRLVDGKKFQAWLRIQIAEAMVDETVEQAVTRMMHLSNIKVEVLENGEWHKEPNGVSPRPA